MSGQVDIGGTWKNIAGVYVNIGGAWKTASSLKCNIGGTWKDGWTSITYGSDFTGGKTYSADTEYDGSYVASRGFDDNVATAWSSSGGYPHWIKVDLGSGVTKTARKLRLYKSDARFLKDFKLQGSNNNTDWTDIYSGTMANSTGWQEFTFSNATGYRYYRVYGTTSWDTGYMQLDEIELMEATP